MADYWYAQHGGAQAGPVPLAELRRLLAAGAIRPDDYVWAEGWEAWRHPGDVPELSPTRGDHAAGARPAEPVEAEVVGAVRSTHRAVHRAVERAAAVAEPAGPILASEPTVTALLRCRPWMMLFAIFGFVVSGAAGIAGAVLVLVGTASDDGGSLLLPLLGLIFIGAAAAYAMPAVHLARGHRALGAVRASRSPADLERAAAAQLRFWRALGLSVVATIIAYVLIIVVAITCG